MAKSWSWSLLLSEDVDNNMSVEIDTPGYDEALTDPGTAELAVGNKELEVPDDATVVFTGETATVTNRTGTVWAQSETVYLYVAAKTATGGGGGELADMQNAIDANTSAIEDLDRRVSQLEGLVGAVRPERVATARVTIRPKKSKGK